VKRNLRAAYRTIDAVERSLQDKIDSLEEKDQLTENQEDRLLQLEEQMDLVENVMSELLTLAELAAEMGLEDLMGLEDPRA
jgi:hypothetical protein